MALVSLEGAGFFVPPQRPQWQEKNGMVAGENQRQVDGTFPGFFRLLANATPCGASAEEGAGLALIRLNRR